ncbi:flagellar hook-length control protein FliK [Saccharibacillus sacchari]|uniref:Flagellar hook-length control protein n=1 Tax=Saccharibacillus sacchari DSM 19268 TaxID=915437 RepID=A0A011A0V3_9BACL|nr:flagellar hook-length control protein FliK [Saccharibacillus sacchari]EXG83132.1 flagellar hook-length control protein [Saccharibacillus sacchari DSM 19268]
MGMTIPGMTVGSAAPVTSGKATAASTTGAAAIFGQSLQQLMGGAMTGGNAGEATETPTNPLLAALQQLIAAAGEASGDEGSLDGEEAEKLDAKVDELLDQLDALDEQLTENPELMPMLQSWIQQAQVVLNAQSQGENAQGEGQEAAASALETLASNPATLKFALQDTVTQLVDMQKSGQTAPEMKVQAQRVLAALEQTVKTVEESAKSGVKQTSMQAAEAFRIQDDVQQIVKNDQNAKPATEAQAKSSEQTVVSSKAQTQQQSGAGTQQEDGRNQETTQEFKTQGTITAGELALRTNGTTPAKPVEAVPMHRMAQEVEKLVVDRLEILQKQGFTEAKITLTPDHLGKVDIRITMHAGQLMAHFVTEHAAAKDMLEQQMVQLRGSLQGQGLTVERLEVTQSSSLQSQMDQNGGQQGNGQQQGRRSRSREEGNDDARLTAELGEELGEWLRQKTAAQAGSSFIAEA